MKPDAATPPRPRTLLGRTFRILGWLLFVVLGLLVLAFGTLEFPGVLTSLARKAISSVSAKTHTRIEVGSLRVSLPGSVLIRDLFVEGQHGDTLVSLRALSLDVDLLGLLSKKIIVNAVRLDSLNAHVARTFPDSVFNFTFLLDAASGPPSASPPRSTSDTSAGPSWEVRVGRVSLRGIRSTYDDETSGLHALVHLGALDVLFNRFDLAKGLFDLGDLSLENTSADIIQTRKTPPPPDTAQPADVRLNLASVNLADLHLRLANSATGERAGVDLDSSRLTSAGIDLHSRRIDVSTCVLAGTSIRLIRTGRARPEAPESIARQSSGTPWSVKCDGLVLLHDSLAFDDENAPPKKGLDPSHLHVENLALRAGGISFDSARCEAAIQQASFREKGGFILRQLSGTIAYDGRHAQLKDFTIETGVSRLRQDLLLTYASFRTLADSPGTVHVTAALHESRVGFADLLYFRPSLPLRPNAALTLSARLSGPINDLQVQELRCAAGSSTVLDLSGSVRGLPAMKNARFDLALRNFSTRRSDFRALLSGSLLPGSITLPDSISLRAAFKGSLRDFSATADLETSIGRANATLAVSGGGDSRRARWRADAAIRSFDVGALLNSGGSLGQVSLRASAEGTGLRKEDLTARLDAEVEQAVLNGYPYQHLSVHGNVSAQKFEGEAAMQDSNIAFTFNGSVDTDTAKPAYRFRLDLKGANLRRLNLSPDDLRVAGLLTSDFAGRNIDDINGTIDVRNAVLVKSGKRTIVDSLVCTVVNRIGESHISIESPLLSARFDGTMPLGSLPRALGHHFGRYFSLHGGTPDSGTGKREFTFNVVLRNPRILTEVFLPQLRRITAGTVEGSFNSAASSLQVNIAVPAFAYGDFQCDDLTLRMSSDADRLQSTLQVRSAGNSTFLVENLQLAGAVDHDSMNVTLQSTGSSGEMKLLLGGVFNSVPDGYMFHFRPGGAVFQGRSWDVRPGGYLLFGRGRFSAHDLALLGPGQSIRLDSQEPGGAHAPLRVDFGKFDLANLLRAIERDTALVQGILDGHLQVQPAGGASAFAADLRIKDLALQQRHVGDITLHTDNQQRDLYTVAMEITGSGNQVALHGTYRNAGDAGTLDLSLDVQTLNLAAFEPLIRGEVDRLSGVMNGGVQVSGPLRDPSVTGTLKFTNTSFSPSILGSYLHLDNGEIAFGGKSIDLRSFTLTDTLGKTASVSGQVTTPDFRSFGFDLRVHTGNFLLINRPADGKALFYGTVFLTSDMEIQGDQASPVINVQAQLDKGTNLAILRPESDAAIQRGRGIVTFVDLKHPANPIMAQGDEGSDSAGQKTRGIRLSSNIEVSRETRLRILVDPASGDSLEIRGEATCSFSIDASGKPTLTGRYEIVSGSYDLSFGKLVKKKFEIAKGSSITWFGSALDADVNITAIYTARASALPLVQNQLSTLSQEERNKYRQELPVQVYLTMAGKLTTPEIHFKLDLPLEQRGALGGAVYAKLNELNGQESELNKQVFALLVLGGFLSENPLASSGGGGGLSGFARTSVSEILSDQLNRLSQQYITGVDLNLGVQSSQDYSTGEAQGRTLLQLGLSTKLFNDRVTVQMGGNVDLEGPRSQQNSLNSFAGDVKVSYALTEDARWQLEVFRQNNYEGLIEGQLMETGAGIVFTIDYDKLFGIGLSPEADKSGEQ